MQLFDLRLYIVRPTVEGRLTGKCLKISLLNQDDLPRCCCLLCSFLFVNTRKECTYHSFLLLTWAREEPLMCMPALPTASFFVLLNAYPIGVQVPNPLRNVLSCWMNASTGSIKWLYVIADLVPKHFFSNCKWHRQTTLKSSGSFLFIVVLQKKERRCLRN